MAARFRVDIAASAEADLRGIIAWYDSKDVPEVGRRLVANVLASVRQLETFPDSGRIVPEFEAPSLRELVVPPFRIVYRRDEVVVTVVRVWRSERLMRPESDTTIPGSSCSPPSRVE